MRPILIALFSLSLTIIAQETMKDTITVLSYNIHHGEGLDGKLDLQRIADVVKRENPDVVAFQEVDVENGVCGGVELRGRCGRNIKTRWHTKKATPKGSPICGGGHAAPTVRPLGMYLHQLLPYPHYTTSPASMV